MKKKTLIFILLGALSVLFIGLCLFFSIRGFAAENKRWEYFDVYKAQAEDYVKASPEIIDKYGNDISVKIDNSVSYSQDRKNGFFNRFYDMFIEVFNPSVPDTIEEFTKDINTLKFKLTVNGDGYEIFFEKNDCGDLVISKLVALDD